MQRLSRFAWVFGLIGLLFLIASATYWYVVGEQDAWLNGFLIVAGVGLAAYAVLDRDQLSSTASSRSVQYGAGATTLVLIAGAVAVGAYALAKRHDHRWDLTEKGAFTLSSYTQGILLQLDHRVTVYAVFDPGSRAEREFRDLIEGYRKLTPHLDLKYVDAVREPMLIRQLVDSYGLENESATVILVDGEHYQILEDPISEQELTNAFVRLPGGSDHRLCWSTGHGEGDPDDDYEPHGYGAVVLQLEDKNYTVTKADLLKAGIDAGCEALLVMSPLEMFQPKELESIAAYLASGGRVLMLLEPVVAPELTADLERYGLSLARDIVVESNPDFLMDGVDPTFLAVGEQLYGHHPIAAPLRSRIILPSVRSVAPLEPAPEGLNTTVVLRASEQSWGETTIDAPVAPAPDEGQDRIGDVPIMVAVEVARPEVIEVAAPAEAPVPAVAPALGQEPALDLGASAGVPADFAPKAGGRLVVVGDSDFASNKLMAIGNNRDLFLNAIAWLLDEEEQIGERPDEGLTETLTPSLLGFALFWVAIVFFVPGAALVAATVVLLRRRRL